VNIENIQRIATFFRVPAEPAPVETLPGVWLLAHSTAADSAALPSPAISIEALGATPAEALAAYQRELVMRGALAMPEVLNAVARAHAYELAATDAMAAVTAELASP